MNHRLLMSALLAGAGLLFSTYSGAQAPVPTINIGVSVTATGPGSSIGIPNKNTIELYPKTLGGVPVNYIVLDDASDPTQAAKNARRFVDSDKVDAIIGSSLTTNSLSIAEIATESRTPQVALAPFTPKDLTWVFPLPTSIDVLLSALFEREIKAHGYKRLAFVGHSDAFGEVWLKGVEKAAKQYGVEIVAVERYARTDQTFTAQALKVLQAKPDFVFGAVAGTPAALSLRTLRERGYKGQFYLTYATANAEFLRAAGNAAEGAILPTGVVLVAEQLPDSHPSKKVGQDYLKRYEDKYGVGSRNVFGGYTQDAYLILDQAAKVALTKARPGTVEFRTALRDALEATKNLPVTHGVVSFTPTDHTGFEEKLGVVLVKIENGKWRYLK